jgi:hypothetical protein
MSMTSAVATITHAMSPEFVGITTLIFIHLLTDVIECLFFSVQLCGSRI